MKPVTKSPPIDAKKALKTLNVNKIWLPLIMGSCITAYLLYTRNAISYEMLSLLSAPRWKYLCMMCLTVILRELGQMLRLRIVTHKKLSWKTCFYVTMLWEFSSQVTPSVVGGGVVAIFLLVREGVRPGQALAYVILIGICDNLFFLITASSSFLGHYEPIFAGLGALGSSAKITFFINYTILSCYTATIFFGLFINPKLLKWILLKVTSISILKRYRRAAYMLAQDIIVASKQFQGERSLFWVQVFTCTLCTWIVRYAFVNCLMEAYVPLQLADHLLIFSKQIIMWAIMLVPIAPGGSGIAEFFFQALYEDTLGSYTIALDIAWRMFNFYLYLTLGAILLPKWLKKVAMQQEVIKDTK